MTAGLAKKCGALTVETDVTYTGWSTIDRYTASFSDGRPPPVIYLKDWNDAFSFAIGANSKWYTLFETQLGYMYDMSPVPERTMTPNTPEANKQHNRRHRIYERPIQGKSRVSGYLLARR